MYRVVSVDDGVNILYTKTNKELEPKQNAEMKRKVNLI